MPLQAGIKAPGFVATDMDNNQISDQIFIGKNTLLLFSSIHCGASKIVSDFITDINFRLPDNLTLIHVYAADSKEDLNKYFRNRTTQFPIITNQKALEYQYQVSGYPILYHIDENGLILQVFEGFEPIIAFLKF
jgi:thioredoxin-related protein